MDEKALHKSGTGRGLPGALPGSVKEPMASHTKKTHTMDGFTPVSRDYPPSYDSAMRDGSSVPYGHRGVYPPSPPPSYNASTMPSGSNGPPGPSRPATETTAKNSLEVPNWLKIGLAAVGGVVGGLLLGALIGDKKSNSPDNEDSSDADW